MEDTLKGGGLAAGPPAELPLSGEIPFSGEHRLTLYSDFGSARPAWESVEATAPSHPFQRYAWLEAWQDTIGDATGSAPVIACVSGRDGRPRALLPLAAAVRGPLRALEWMGAPVSDYSGALVIPDAGIGGEVLAAAVRAAGRAAGCGLVDLGRNPALIGGAPNPILGKAFREEHYGSHSLLVPRDLDAFLKSRLGSKGAYNLRRAERLLEGLGRLEFVVAGDEESRAAIVDAMIRHKRERCRAAGLRDNFDDPGYEAFYRTAPGRLGDLAQVSALFLDGRPVAEHWGLRDRDCLYYLMPAFEAGELEKYSVGSVLILRLLGLCASEGIARMDFAAGDEPYKERWCPERMPIYSLEAGLGFAGALISLSLRAVRSAKKGPVLAAGRRIKKALRGALRSIGSRS